MERVEKALRCFDEGFNCCQAVLRGFYEELNVDKDMTLKMGTGFGAGMRTGQVCGAVTGAIMVLGLKHGHCIQGDIQSKEKTNNLTKKFQEKFKELHGTTLCKELLGYDVSSEEDMQIVREKGLFNTVCPLVIKDAVEIIEDIV